MQWMATGDPAAGIAGIPGLVEHTGGSVVADVPFAEILALLEAHGWVLQRVWPPYFVFVKEGKLPLLVPVQDRKVSEAYVEKIRNILEADEA
jgi:hypothetical protein